MPFAGMINREIVDLQMDIKKKINVKKKNINEILEHNNYYDCLTCHYRCLGDDETLFPPYGSFRWEKMAYHVMTHMRHLIVYRYLDTNIDIFLKGLKVTNFLQYDDIPNVKWTFEFCNKTGILKVKKCTFF